MIVFFLLSCLLGAVCAHAQSQPASQSDRVQAWREDLRQLVEELPKRHISPFTKLSRDDFQKAALELESRLGTLSDIQIQVELLRLIARIGDSHTVLSDLRPQFGRYPLSVVRLKDGFFINAVAEVHRAALGARIVRINMTEIDDAVRLVATVFPYENDATLNRWVCNWLVIPEVLGTLGIIDDPNEVRFSIVHPDGTTSTLDLRPMDSRKASWVTAPEKSSIHRPALQLPRQSFYWFEHLPESKTVFFRYDRCANDPQKSILPFTRELLEFIDANDVQRVIIDLRFNGGGNSALFKPILLGLKARKHINQHDRLLVLIGPGTFSSGMLNAWELKTQTNAKLIGRPTGQKPNAFGEVRSFKLAHSGITVHYSTKRFNMIAGRDPPSLEPDVTIEPGSTDYFSGRDVTLEAVLAYPLN